jgi:hypothetical protein
MRLLTTAARELFGLFVGDLSHTLSVLAWVALIFLLARALGSPAWLGPLLFVGLAGILLENVLRAAARGRQ